MLKKRRVMKMTVSHEEYMKAKLRQPREACLYLEAALEEYEKDGNMGALLLALKRVAEARGGVSQLAKKTSLNRENLYRTLSKKGNPRLQTLLVILHAFGFRLVIKPLISRAS